MTVSSGQVCASCGQRSPSASAFCEGCGSWLGDPADAPAALTAPPPPPVLADLPPGTSPPAVPAEAASTNGLSIAALVLGIFGGMLVVGPLLAVVFGHVARGQIRRSGGTQRGSGLALAGLILGYVSLFAVVAATFAMVRYLQLDESHSTASTNSAGSSGAATGFGSNGSSSSGGSPLTTPPYVAPLTTRETTSTPPVAAATGDLGIAGHQAVGGVPCNGSYVTFVGAITSGPSASRQVSRLLSTYPGSSYFLTSASCPSLRAAMPDGSLIYAVYFGPFSSASEACSARSRGPSDAYVKRLVTDPNGGPVSC